MYRRRSGSVGVEPLGDKQDDFGEIFHPSVVTILAGSGEGVDLLCELLRYVGCFDLEVLESGEGQHRCHR